jgi:hypothetical protein
MKRKYKYVLIFLCCCGLCTAQQVVSSSGYAVKSEISVDWVLGGNVSAIPAYSPGVPAGIQEEFDESGISLKVYPSPAIDFFNIEITPADTGRFILDLYNNSGMKILNVEVANQPLIQVNISDFPCGIYFLKVFLSNNDQPIKVEKIVKTQTNPL